MNNVIIKSILLIVFSLQSVYAINPGTRRQKARKLKNSYIHAYKNYEFKSCQKFENENNENYYVICEDGIYHYPESIKFLSKSFNTVNKHVAKNDFLLTLQSKIKKKLETRLVELVQLKLCLNDSRPNEKCRERKKSILKGLKRDLPKVRSLLAQMNMPGKIYSAKKPIRFEISPIHPLSGVKIKPIYNKNKKDGGPEYKALINHTEDLEETFSVDAYLENPNIKGKKVIISNYVNKKFEEQNKIYKDEYNELISKRPILSLLKVSAIDSDKEILDDVYNNIDKMIGSIQSTMGRVIDLGNDNLKDLLRYNSLVEDELQNRDNKLYCDIAQELKEDIDFEEFAMDTAIAGLAISLPIACTISYGLGCSLGALALMETAAIARSFSLYDQEQDLFYSGESTSQRTRDREIERQISVYLAPLSFIGAESVRAIKEAKDFANDLVTQSKRYDFKQRKELKKLKNKLNKRYDRMMEIFNPDNIHDLSKADQIYLAGILDRLKRYGYTHDEIRNYMNSLIIECKGLSK